MKQIKEKLHRYRFPLFLITLVFNLFGTLLFHDAFFTAYLFPIGLLLNIAAGINLISNKKLKILVTGLFLITAFTSGFSMLKVDDITLNMLRFVFYSVFYVVITYEIIKQIWLIKGVGENLIIGVVSGYITLGLVGFFIFMSVEMQYPGSFESPLFKETFTIHEKSDSLLYYSYITLMAIGYGEIVPVTTIAQKAAILLGLLGQFYVMIITAVVVGKYINYAHK